MSSKRSRPTSQRATTPNKKVKTPLPTFTDARMEMLYEMRTEPNAKLVLKDGTSVAGFSFGAMTSTAGEVVFNTGMVGYPEALTDPSYRGQILVLTFPLIGNYGVPDRKEKDEYGLPKWFESDKIQISGLIVADYCKDPSHWSSINSLGDWLKEYNIPGIYGIDTRELTKRLRTQGATLGKMVVNDVDIPFQDPNQRNLVAEVSIKEPVIYGTGKFRILAVDCGMKNNIVRCFLRHKDIPLSVKVVPWDYDFTKEEWDGLFLSNGPGDPTMVTKTVEHVKVALQGEKPIFGICLGNQVLGLAAGAKTYKMKFGNRSMNQPCIDLRTNKCYITPQNHGYAVDADTLPPEWTALFTNANDRSNEGIVHTWKPFLSVQFHPEAMGGPCDTSFLLDDFLRRIQTGRNYITTIPLAPSIPPQEKVLLLGSGGLSIGQAGEFDYSGSQAIKALKERNMQCVLINPNIATVQTSDRMAHKVYFLPVTPEYVESIIIKEKPTGILLQFGGQTALNCGIALKKMGILDKYGVNVLGTSVRTIEITEDRKLFGDILAEIKESTAPSFTAETVDEALNAADRIGYPVLVRSAFALGGLGSGFARNPEEMKTLSEKALGSSTQVIVDKSLKGWKEVEYEVVRDCLGNCITVCNMENFDPLGIHTGDSIVVAPSQTLSNRDFFRLRRVAIKVVTHLQVVGECNIQFALDPNSDQYCIIEVNARLSRSSALASKATGYPLAYVAARLALGSSLVDIKNSVTKTTTACFEPALDYVVVKMPRWDTRKFHRVDARLGSAMKSVGEVMAIGRTFEEAFSKAMRMVDGHVDGFGDISSLNHLSQQELDEELRTPSDLRPVALAVAFRRGYPVSKIKEMTNIDSWFLHKLQHIIKIEDALSAVRDLPNEPLSPQRQELALFLRLGYPAIRYAKVYGLSDAQIARAINSTANKDEVDKVKEENVRSFRLLKGIVPLTKQIDTLAAEWPAETNYLYMTYLGSHSDVPRNPGGVMVLGCGPYRIGSSCEFDWCAVSTIRTLRQLDYRAVMVNFNPETVSTDYDECERLYFEELSLERVLDIYQKEACQGVIVGVGGQIPNTLAVPLAHGGCKILGTSPASIDTAEDRSKFSKLLDHIGVAQPPWKMLTTLDEAQAFAERIQYPILVRPSYVLSGAAMNVARSKEDLKSYLTEAAIFSKTAPVVISKFIKNSKEIEYDGVADNGRIVNFAISEHVENAGVHSGDATLVLPAQNLFVETVKRLKKTASRIAAELKITGPFNIQFLAQKNEIQVIECNLRCSRSLPFVSKTFNVNFVELATKVMVGVPVKAKVIDLLDLDYVCVKVPMFSFTRLLGADPVLRVEMASTGEVACFGNDIYEAYLKGWISTGYKLPEKSVVLSIGSLQRKVEFLESAKLLNDMGFEIYATSGTAEFYAENGVLIESFTIEEVLKRLQEKRVDLVINIPTWIGGQGGMSGTEDTSSGYKMRRCAVDFGIPLIQNIKCAMLFIDALDRARKKPKMMTQIYSHDEYMRRAKII